ncbi:phage baseplate assembly protein [Halomonas sp. CSM-2]|uniref:phage baseplate assembly protein n=1 Tax=Halomonas sp. CSM-2 TaxID=1975722 RepID=UPI0034E8FC10
MSELALIVDGTRHLGWKEIQIRRSLDEMADGFELVLSEKWPTATAPPSSRAACALANR